MGQRAEMAEAIQLLKQVFEKGNLIPGILLRPPLLVLQKLAQISAGWEEGSPLVMLNWKVRPVCPISQMGSQASSKGRTTESRENGYMACPGWMHHPQPSCGALTSLFKNRDVLFWLQRPLWLGSLQSLQATGRQHDRAPGRRKEYKAS